MPQTWGGVDQCPACLKSVYPTDKVYAADRKVFHKRCLQCQVNGCRNELTARGIHKHEGYNFCDRCHEEFYDPRFYGVRPGEESLEDYRDRMAREAAERERRLKEIAEAQRRGPEKDDFQFPACIKIAETVMMAG